MDTAIALLRRAGGMGFDRHLFLIQLQEREMVDLSPFSDLCWRPGRSFSRPSNTPAGHWLLEEPLFFNSFLSSRLLSSENVRARLLVAGCSKLGHILRNNLQDLSQRSGVSFLQQCIAEIFKDLSTDYQVFLKNPDVLNEWVEG